HLMTTASIPSTVTSLQEMAFCNCENLVTVSYNGTTAEWNALSKKPSWQGCTSLTAITCTDGSVPVVR
ncbi:MAG: leucine-rich repeat domain-containing protein, partial [Bacilli bacterium]|nr:leucine-rich repeat domain-containing protein [Bacilli bacterium]